MDFLAVGGKVYVNSVLRGENLIIRCHMLKFLFDYLLKNYSNTWTSSYLEIDYPKIF